VYNLAVGSQPGSDKPNARLPQRRSSLRLPEFDYSTPGAYFITICTARKSSLFGQVVADGVSLTAAGSMVASTWSQLPHHYPAVQTDAFIVMPNHIHGILVLTGEHPDEALPNDGQAWEPAPTPEPNTTQQAGLKPDPTFSLSDVVHRLKTLTTRRFAELQHESGRRPTYRRLWQRNYYEHVIRDDDSLQRIREYIANNPLAWDLDRENPSARPTPRRTSVTEPWQV
jgi:putative transposase